MTMIPNPFPKLIILKLLKTLPIILIWSLMTLSQSGFPIISLLNHPIHFYQIGSKHQSSQNRYLNKNKGNSRCSMMLTNLPNSQKCRSFDIIEIVKKDQCLISQSLEEFGSNQTIKCLLNSIKNADPWTLVLLGLY